MSHAQPDSPQIKITHYIFLIVAFSVTIPGLYFGITHSEIYPPIGTLIFGLAVFGGAFILAWAAEVAQLEISESLAVAILALIAVLPEYAVDFVFTWNAAHDPSQAQFAIANMTGANRLLVGLGWPAVLAVVVFIKGGKSLSLHQSQRVEIFYLAMATLYSFTIPLKGYLSLWDTLILVMLFAMYTRRAAKMESKEPELVGPVLILASLSKTWRRIGTVFFFVYAGIVILFVAEPFTHALLGTGQQFGIDQFLLVQWLAPIASEAPEFIIAITWALRGAAGSAIKALISSKVNQWTLLVGTIPLVFSISSGAIKPFILDGFQQHELLLTASQSLFAVAVLVNLRLSKLDGILLVLLFSSQLIYEQIRMEVAAVYIILAIIFHIKHRKCLIPAARWGLGFKENN